jgi:hypothetical protein
MRLSRSILLQTVSTLIFVTLCGWSAYAGPPQFQSQAKLVAGARPDAERIQWDERLKDFYGTIIETVESPELKRKAAELVNALFPDLKTGDVTIQVRQSKGSAIFTLTATGSEPKHTQIFLNALLDEFIAFRQMIREQAQGKVLSTFLQEVVNKQKEMETAMDAKARAETANGSLAKLELERLGERLKMLSNERDDLKMNASADSTKKQRLDVLDAEIKRVGEEITRNDEITARIKDTSERAQTARTAYEQMFKRAENFMNMFNTQSDYVAVMERASISVLRPENGK